MFMIDYILHMRCAVPTENKSIKSYCSRSLTFFYPSLTALAKVTHSSMFGGNYKPLKNFNMYSNSLPSLNVNHTLHTL